MGAVNLAFFDLDRLVLHLNSRLQQENQLNLGTPVPETSKPTFTGWTDYIGDSYIKTESILRIPLEQNLQDARFMGTFECPDDILVGYFIVEKGEINPEQTPEAFYELVKLSLERKLELKDGIIIPRGTIKLLKTSGDPYSEDLKRQDHKRVGFNSFGYNQRADLSDYIPTLHFLSRTSNDKVIDAAVLSARTGSDVNAPKY